MDKVSEIRFTDKEIKERWERVEEDFWGDLKRETVIAVQSLLENRMGVEIQDLVGARRWKHIRPRPTYRNGSYFRSFLTTMGLIPLLKVPRVRGGFRFNVLSRYAQRAPDVDAGIVEMFLGGVSTRRVKEVLRPLMGSPTVSAGTVSNVCKILNSRVEGYHRRLLKDDYLYLILDGIYLKTKSPLRVKRRCILVAYGIGADGVRELIDFKMVRAGESQVAWESFLTGLKNRGLEGEKLKLIGMDGNKGLWNAVDLVWLNVPRQRCWAHKLRNVANHVPHKLHKPCLGQAKAIYDAESKEKALKELRTWAKVWRPIVPKAVECLEEDFEDLLTFFDCPKNLWKKLRTTNAIERTFREVRRRTRPISCFQNRESVERIIFAVFYRQNALWRDKPLTEITHNI